MGQLKVNYELSDITDDLIYGMVSENPNYYLDIEKAHLEKKGIKVYDVDYANSTFTIDLDDHYHLLSYINIPYTIYDFEKITKRKTSDKTLSSDANTYLKPIISYMKKNKIDIGRYKPDVGKKGILELSCWICSKHNLKLYMFLDSFNILTHSKTDCMDDKHKKVYLKVKNDLKSLVKKTKDLNKEFINWNPDYVFVKYDKSESFKITLKEHWEIIQKLKADDKDIPEIYSMQVLIVKHNILRLLKHYEIDIKYNVISKSFDIFIFGKKSIRNLKYVTTEILDYIECRRLKITKDKLTDLLVNIGLTNKYNPIEDYLIDNHSKTKLNDSEFKRLLSCIKTDSENVYEKLKRFLLQSVYLITRDEDNLTDLHAEFILLLQGGQGKFKSTFAKSLLPPQFKSNYFLEASCVNVNDKDEIFKFSNMWLIELGEVGATFKKSDRDSIKNYITAFYDFIRRPYDREYTKLPRRHSFIASTNDIDYLQDPTGSRRFVCLNDVEFNIDKLKNIDINKIWSWIYDCYLNGDKFYFDKEELKQIQDENMNHTNKTTALLILEGHFNLKSNDSVSGLLLKDCYNHFLKTAVNSEIEVIKSKMILKKYFNQLGVKKKYDSCKKTDVYFIDLI